MDLNFLNTLGAVLQKEPFCCLAPSLSEHIRLRYYPCALSLIPKDRTMACSDSVSPQQWLLKHFETLQNHLGVSLFIVTQITWLRWLAAAFLIRMANLKRNATLCNAELGSGCCFWSLCEIVFYLSTTHTTKVMSQVHSFQPLSLHLAIAN